MSEEPDQRNASVAWSTDDLVSLDLPRSSLNRRDFLKATGVGAGIALGSGTGAASTEEPPNAKTRATYWTKADRLNARENIEQFQWAAQERDRGVETADSLLASYDGLDDLWRFVTSQEVARSSFISPFYHWNTPYLDSWNSLDRRWKMTAGDYVLPTNDFASYRESGRDDRGMFDPELADDQYLVNEEHPEMGEGWGVDDGYGWQDANDDLGQGEGAWWTFVAYYNHWGVWRPGGIVNLLRALTDAYLYTGDRKYATAGTLLLDRIADVYPEMNTAAYPSPANDGHYRNNTGGRQTGRVIGSHWEPNLVSPILVAYDAFFPGQEDNAELVDFLHAKTEEFPGLDAKDTIGKIRKNIEDGFHREMLPAAKESQLVIGRGSRGAVSRSARVLDEPDGYTKEALDWVFKAGSEVFNSDGYWQRHPDAWETTGGNTVPPLVGGGPGVGAEDRDGYFNESAPLYNEIRMASIEKVANILQGYDGFEGADLYEHPKFKRMLTQNSELILLDQHTPEIADTHVQRADNYMHTSSMKNGFEAYGEPEFAQLWYYLNGNSTAGIRGDIFSDDPEELGDEVKAIIEAEGPLDLPSQNLAGYGFAALRDGENYTRADYGVAVSFDAATVAEATAGYEIYEGSGTFQFESETAGEHVTFEFEVPESADYQVELSTYRADTYGDAKITIDGESFTTFDFTVPESEQGTYDLEPIGTKRLSAGTHTITFTSGEFDDGSDDDDDFTFGVRDLMLLTPEDLETRRNAREKGNAKRAFWMTYGRNENNAGATSHAHRDTLNLGVAAFELELANDLGYPKLTSPKSNHFTRAAVSHNTAVVDAEDQHPQWVGEPKHFDSSDDRVQLMDVAAPDAYPQTDEYRRTTAMVRVDDADSYAVDFFRIDGGGDHLFNFHGWKVDEGSTTLADGVEGMGSGSTELTTADAYQGEESVRVTDRSTSSASYAGLSTTVDATDFEASVYVNSAVTADDYKHHVQVVYLGDDSSGNAQFAGIGNAGGSNDPAIGLYSGSGSWVEKQSMSNWTKDEWYELVVAKSGTTVDVTLVDPADGSTFANGSFTLPEDTNGNVGFLGEMGSGQTGALYFDEFSLADHGTVTWYTTTGGSGVETTGLDLTEQDGGTYAGQDVPLPGPAEDTPYNEEVGNGFNYFDDVARDDDPDETFSVDWDVEDWWDVRDVPADTHLRLTTMNDVDEVAMADGHPPIQDREGNPEDLRYALIRRQGTDLTTTFTSVVEPYAGERYVESIESVPVEVGPQGDGDDYPDEFDPSAASDTPPSVRAVKVELTNGRIDYVVSTADRETLYTVDRRFQVAGSFAQVSFVDDGPESAYLNDGTLLRPIHPTDGDDDYEASSPPVQRAFGRFVGTVQDFTREMSFDNEVTIQLDGHQREFPDDVGEQIHIQAEGPSGDRDVRGNGNGTYPVEDASLTSGNSVTVNVGERTFIRAFKDAKELADGGYHYVINEGDEVIAPVSSSWSA